MEQTIEVPTGPEGLALVGAAERNLKMIRETLGINITARSGLVQLRGDRRGVSVAHGVIARLKTAPKHRQLSRQEVLEIIADESSHYTADDDETRAGDLEPTFRSTWDAQLEVYASGKPVRPKTPNQEAYLEAIRTKDLVFAIGPAGTGKTYLAVAAAVHLLRTDRVKKAILVRPAVEAGEKLGYLPGGIEAKVNPYLRPLLDALHDMMDYSTIRRFMETDVVEIVPLAYMRGRTLNNAVIILDEAQNTTRGQMQMFLTRTGQGSKMIITGDTTQIDLPDPSQSGLIDAARRLRPNDGIGFVSLDRTDVIRHPLVQQIIDAYGPQEGAGPQSDLNKDPDELGAPSQTADKLRSKGSG